jgi:mono/diheme cytochrome c family protein
MKSKYYKPLILLILWSLLVVSCASLDAGPESVQETGAPERLEPPEEYAGMTNPFTGDAEAAAEGEALYQSNCYSCHGQEARGDGPAAAALEPRPSDLARDQSSLSDPYLYWRIAEGGMRRPFNSVMPAWRGILSEEQIWEIITFLRTLENS